MNFRSHYVRVATACLCALLSATAIAGNAETSAVPALLHNRLSAVASTIARRTADPAASLDTRDLGNAALTTLVHGGSPAVAQAELERAFATQDGDPTSATYGQVRWRTGDAGFTDANAAPFFGQAVAAVLSGYRDRLPAAYVAALRPKVAALAQALEHRSVPVAYTNIYVMRAVDLVLLGQYLQDSGVTAAGRSALHAWVAQTRATGIAEFDSVWYYPVDLGALSQCARYAEDPDDRSTCTAALRYFWTDIAANYFPAAHKLSGPSSREYDFVTGNGDLPYWLESVGWSGPDEVGHSNLEGVYVEDLLANGGYRPTEAMRALAFGGPRDVTSTYDAYPGHTRWNWVGKHVSLGCAGGSYGGQDKMLVATFAGPAAQAQLNVMMQKSGAAYGVQSATQKPEHVAPSLGCIAHGGAALATFFVQPSLLGAIPHGFETDVIFPRDASLAVNGRPVSLAGGDVALKPGDILAVAAGGGVVALQTLRVDTVADPPALRLTTDARGSARGAAWLAIVHLKPNQTANPGSIVHESFAIVARDDGSIAAATSELAAANARDALGPATWRVSATFPQGRFELARSSTNRGSISPGTIDGSAPQRFALGIDGRDAGAPVWRGTP